MGHIITNLQPPLKAISFHLVIISSICLFLALGQWQLHRLAWKEGLIYQLNSAYTDTTTFDSGAENTNFKPVMIRGELLHEHSIAIGIRTHNGKAGKHLFTPLKTENNQIVFINRGWIPLRTDLPIVQPKGAVQICGVITIPEKPGFFTPHNVPCRHEWYSFNSAELRRHLNAKEVSNTDQILDYYISAKNSTEDINLPLPVNIKASLRNPHLGYAVTWFGMAIACSVCYLILIIKGLKKE